MTQEKCKRPRRIRAMTQEKFKFQATDRDQPIEMVESYTPDTSNSLEATIPSDRANATVCPRQCNKIATQIQKAP